MKDQTRNLNPTPQALVAMWIWGSEYAAQGGGSMDFYDSLSLARQRQCDECVEKMKVALEQAERVKVRHD